MAYRLLENLSKRELEDLTDFRLLDSGVVIAVYPDPFKSTSLPKTQAMFAATALIKNYDPFTAVSQLRGTTN